jgi:hypothetical protein
MNERSLRTYQIAVHREDDQSWRSGRICGKSSTSWIAGLLVSSITRRSTPKPSKVIRAADLSPTIYLETEAEVETFITKLKAELLDAIKAGQRARIS